LKGKVPLLERGEVKAVPREGGQRNLGSMSGGGTSPKRSEEIRMLELLPKQQKNLLSSLWKKNR